MPVKGLLEANCCEFLVLRCHVSLHHPSITIASLSETAAGEPESVFVITPWNTTWWISPRKIHLYNTDIPCIKTVTSIPCVCILSFLSPVYVWGLWCQKHVSQAGISKCILQHSVGCNYLSMLKLPAADAKVLFSCNLHMSSIYIVFGPYHVICRWLGTYLLWNDHLWNVYMKGATYINACPIFSKTLIFIL